MSENPQKETEMKDTKWAYGRADDGDLGEYAFQLGIDRDDALSLAADFASDQHGYGEEAPTMVVYEMRPILIGKPVVTPGEELGDGDKEPDEFDRLDWQPVEGSEG